MHLWLAVGWLCWFGWAPFTCLGISAGTRWLARLRPTWFVILWQASVGLFHGSQGAPRERAEARGSFWGLGLGLPQCLFLCLLLFQVRNKANPDSKSREIDSAFYVESCIAQGHGNRERKSSGQFCKWLMTVSYLGNLKAATIPGAGAHKWVMALVALNIDLWEVLVLPHLEVLLSLSTKLKVPQMFWEQTVACSHCCCL